MCLLPPVEGAIQTKFSWLYGMDPQKFKFPIGGEEENYKMP
jgi:hypothetical protein